MIEGRGRLHEKGQCIHHWMSAGKTKQRKKAGVGLPRMPIRTGTKAELSKCPKCGKPLNHDMAIKRAISWFSATYGKLPNGKYYLVWVDKK